MTPPVQPKAAQQRRGLGPKHYFPQWIFCQWQPPIPPGYGRWRQQFLLRRIPLACKVGILIQLGFLAVQVVVEFPLAARLEGAAIPVGLDRFQPYFEAGLGIAMLSLIWALAQLPRVKRRPEPLILLFPLALLVVPELPDLLFLTPNSFHMNLLALIVFIYQAILLPVCWRQHLMSQTIALSFIPIGVSWTVLSRWSELAARGRFSDGTLTQVFAEIAAVLSYQLLLGGISLINVAFQERFFIREFDLRDRLQLFLHAISHDLRPPAMGTIMLLKQLRQPSGEAEITPAMLQQMLASGDRQLQLIDSLQLAQESEAQLQLSCQRVCLQQLVSSVIQGMQPLLEQANASTVQSIPAELPPVFADPLQLRRVYENLLANALQYNGPGLEIVFTAQQHGNELLCQVRDNGKGMTQEQCDRLFERYSRAINSRHPLHLGLGLYICRQIILAHGGEIRVESNPQQGTTFWFSLPT